MNSLKKISDLASTLSRYKINILQIILNHPLDIYASASDQMMSTMLITAIRPRT